MSIILRAVWALLTATVYKLATNAYLQAALIALHDWRLSLYWLGGWWVLVILAVSTGVTRKSRLAGLEHVDILTARKLFHLLGDEQQGWIFPPDSKLPRWLLPYVCCGWRNKLRNIAFWSPLKWLHVPMSGKQDVRQVHIGALLLSVRWRSQLTELEWEYPPRRWFGDVGPRLNQPVQWGGYSWAFRLFGRY